MGDLDLTGLSKPAVALIEKISIAVGAVCKPVQIKRVAKAEAEALIIKAEAEIEVSAIHERGVARLLHQQTFKQKNIEDITLAATPLLHENANPEGIENDWLANFFSKCENVSNKEVQTYGLRS